MDPSEIGRFGTLRLMKRVDPATPVAAFPIDDDTVTFGRDPSCSVRLYYSSVSPVHAKLIFQEKKAFVVVLGTSGILVDGCLALPSQNPSLPVTIPVPNNSTLEIRGKRFVFTYPPKEMRAALYSSPSPTKNASGSSVDTDAEMTPRTRKKMLRMSLIRSAKVFTPRGKHADPVENLRILQTPLKRRGSSPLKQQYQTLQGAHNGQDSDSSSDSDAADENDGDENEAEKEIVLVDGDHPHVLEEDKDLVILESVEVEVPEPPHSPRPQQSAAPPATPHRLGAFGRPVSVQTSNPNMYQTPHRKPARPSLHRAVLIRSAQRAVLRQEIEQEEEELEEKEVEEVIVDDLEDVQEIEEEDEEEEDRDEETEETDQSSGWRKSLGLVKGLGWPFRSSSAAPEDDEKHEKLENEKVEMDVDQEAPPLSTEDLQQSDLTDALPAHRPLGTFMTPQISRVSLTTGVGRGAGRNSFGGHSSSSSVGLGGPQRVRVEPKWKVTDIVVPVPDEKEEEEMDLDTDMLHMSPRKVKQEEQVGMGVLSPQRRKLSEEEKQAIRERRRSALRTPDPYFGGYVPGMGPRHSNVHAQAPLPGLFATTLNTNATKTDVVGKGRSRSLSPVKMAMRFGSPAKVGVSIEEREEEGRSESDDEENTRSLLDRMKQTVEGLKRRRSESGLVQSGESSGSMVGTRVDLGDNQENDNESVDGTEEEDGKSDVDESDKENGDVQSDDGGPMDVEVPAAPDIGAENRAEGDLPASNQGKDEDAPTDLPLPALTRPSPQTPQLGSLKHLFSKPKHDVGAATPAVRSMRHLFKGVPISREGVQTPSMDGVKTMFLREERRGRVGDETPTMEGVKEMMVTPVVYRQQASAGKESYEHDDGNDEKATELGHAAVPPTPATRRRPPRLNANSGVAATEGTAVSKLEEVPTDDIPGLPTIEVPDAPSETKPLRLRKQTPVNDERNPLPPSASSEPKAVGGRKIKAESHSEVVPTAPKRPPSRAKGAPIPEVVVEPKVTRNKPVVAATRPKSRLGTTKAGQGSSSTVPPNDAAARGTRSGVRRVGGTTTSSGTNNARGRSGSGGSGSGSRSGRSTPSETAQPAEEDDNDPLDTIGHAAEEDGPGSKRRTRTTTTTMKAKRDVAEGGVAGPASRTRRAPTPSTVKPPAAGATKAGTSTARKKAGSMATTKAVPEVSSEVVDKENTPSKEEESASSGQDTSGNATIVKTATTTRARRGTTAGAKSKEGEKEESGGARTGGAKTRTTRATTRSRT
ncbi:hypothetical protein BKA82DRAFT_1005572 [Pisolithus tinctorius]|uniref:FHA domain-containing protein n=1 Tax=Pisolithus tinctorius Marx 270 TaxID=870435 RepID=A0A0C3NSF1_PISTI|nr:hypothetical protein BKA82DRAFT_1005572 [Pisolithus tinctorius]KIN98208.1 hypothetical protein M404DRAFT_1005572 [Pisolithus tinctorius Marx 270]